MKKFIFKGFLSNKFCGSLLVRARSSRAELARILIEPSSSLKSQLDLKFELEPSQLESSSSRARAESSSARLGSFTALAVIHDDEGYDWSEILPEEDAVGYAFAAGKIVPFKDTRTEEEKFVNRRMKAQTKVSRIYTIYKEAKRAKRWDPDRECYLDPQAIC
ncbi:hypothetical protein HanRHA438_Chr07g0296551 [Helianthus annuus]|nr:hypothetical protein HanRHA438_Chr07g0296551 [Helianthus annuus]